MSIVVIGRNPFAGRCEEEGGGAGTHEAGTGAQGTLPRDSSKVGVVPLRLLPCEMAHLIQYSRVRLTRIVR
jgi:hypothetical protein